MLGCAATLASIRRVLETAPGAVQKVRERAGRDPPTTTMVTMAEGQYQERQQQQQQDQEQHNQQQKEQQERRRWRRRSASMRPSRCWRGAWRGSGRKVPLHRACYYSSSSPPPPPRLPPAPCEGEHRSPPGADLPQRGEPPPAALPPESRRGAAVRSPAAAIDITAAEGHDHNDHDHDTTTTTILPSWGRRRFRTFRSARRAAAAALCNAAMLQPGGRRRQWRLRCDSRRLRIFSHLPPPLQEKQRRRRRRRRRRRGSVFRSSRIRWSLP